MRWQSGMSSAKRFGIHNSQRYVVFTGRKSLYIYIVIIIIRIIRYSHIYICFLIICNYIYICCVVANVLGHWLCDCSEWMFQLVGDCSELCWLSASACFTNVFSFSLLCFLRLKAGQAGPCEGKGLAGPSLWVWPPLLCVMDAWSLKKRKEAQWRIGQCTHIAAHMGDSRRTKFAHWVFTVLVLEPQAFKCEQLEQNEKAVSSKKENPEFQIEQWLLSRGWENQRNQRPESWTSAWTEGKQQPIATTCEVYQHEGWQTRHATKKFLRCLLFL